MKKVAILTTHRANNFGAQLQAFALVSKVNELGCDAEILDWRSPHFEWSYYKSNHFSWKALAHPGLFVYYIQRLLWFRGGNRKISDLFDRFRSNYQISKKYAKKDELYKVEQKYDLFLAGSDQIWNPMNTAMDKVSYDRTYLLDFCKDASKKRAYAASVGVKEITPDSLVPEFKRLLAEFSAITVREFAAADLVEKLIGKRPEVVLDPVLLQSRSFWTHHFAVNVFPGESYVLLYNMHRSALLRSEAVKYARERNLKVLEVVLPSRPGQSWDYGIVPVYAGPKEFLTLIAHAKAVFTASFHASALSVLFHRTLYVETRGGKDNANSRIDTLFQTVAVERDVSKVYQEAGRILQCLNVTDWDAVDSRLEQARRNSEVRLKIILEI